MNILKSSGAVTAPCDTPALIPVGGEIAEPMRTEKKRSSKKWSECERGSDKYGCTRVSGVIWVICTIRVVARKINIRYVSEMGFGYEHNIYSVFLKGEITVVKRASRGLIIDLKSFRNLEITFSRLLEEEELAFLF
ncbi:hypothetical protein QTP88_019832 [Uroleucon formosanum]